MSSTAPAVRVAEPEDREAVVATVVAAFANDPAWAFISGGEMERVAPYLAGALFDSRVGEGTVWVAGDCVGVAMWDDLTGRRLDEERRAAVWAGYREDVGEVSWGWMQRYDDALHALEPAKPFWYLGVLAAHPSVQGTGVATAVLAPGFAAAEAGGHDCWLETSVPANTEFYARRGFTERVPVTIEGGPQTWWMRRRPLGPGASVRGGRSH